MIDELRVRPPRREQPSARSPAETSRRSCSRNGCWGEPALLLLDEPTRGIDVGAKAEIYALMIKLIENGAAIVMVSSELPEVLGMSHRVLAVRAGRIVREFSRDEATPDAVIAAATGAAA